MVYIPRRFKFKKLQKGLYRLKGFYYCKFKYSLNPFLLSFGRCSFRMNPAQMETYRRVVKRSLKRSGKFFFFFSCTLPITAKKGGIRMGKGKGAVLDWTFPLKRGMNIAALCNINYRAAFLAFRKAAKKIPCSLGSSKNSFYPYSAKLGSIE